MNRHYRGRALAAFLVALIGVSLVPASAMAAASPARAALLPIRQFIGDSTGRLLTFRVKNTGTIDGVGSVRIEPPSSFWTETSCPFGPPGWTRALIADACEYTSAPGNGDDIPLGQGRYFKIRATTAGSDHNVWGTWRVRISPDDDLAPIENVVDAAPMGLGLQVRAFTFEVVDAVVSDSSATVGNPCPDPDKSAVAGSTGNFVIVCGRNHANTTLTPVNANSKLLGSMITSHGAFTGGPVPSSDNVVVLGYWSNVQVTGNVGSGKAMRLRVGSADNRTSPVRRIGGFEAVSGPSTSNIPPTLVAGTLYVDTISEDPGPPIPNVSGGTPMSSLVDLTPPSGGFDNVGDPDGPGLGIAIIGGTGAGTLWYSPDGGASWANVGTPSAHSVSNALLLAANGGLGRLYYEPAMNVNGVVGVIQYLAWDQSTGTNGGTANTAGAGSGTSAFSAAGATGSITILPLNDPPTAANASFSMNENTTASFPIPGVLDDAADIDGDSLQAILVTGPAHHSGTFALNADGTFSYTPTPSYVGSDSFTWKAQDPSGAQSSEVTVSITVNNVGGGGGGGGCLISC